MKDIILVAGCFAGAAVLIIAAVVILVATFRKKPGQKAEKSAKTKARNQKPAKSYDYAAYQDDEKTQAVRQPASGGITYEIRLISLNNLNDTWTLNIAGEVLAGRSEYASIHFDDKSVSREQFRIIATASGLAVVHCGSTNKTTVND
ncbi:MAG: FHA domain-containing protein [Oscillospiraceae bacterium]|nr:FHA domain-containing protein [Oscillospiraceae bacterium]